MTTPTIPAGAKVSYRQQYRRCGKPGCPTCSDGAPGHGPYWYAFWWAEGKVRSRYVGKILPAEGDAESEQADSPAAQMAQDAPLGDADSLWVHTLGGFAVWRGAAIGEATRLAAEEWTKRKKAAALFKWLLAAEGCRLPREALMDALWPDAEPATAATNLRYTVHLLRKMLDRPGAGWSHIAGAGNLLALVPAAEGSPPPGWLDAAAFEALAAAALAGQSVEACRAALAIYQGDYLPDDAYEDWAARRREELRARYLELLLHTAALASASNDAAEAQRCLRRVLEIEPSHEPAARELIRLLALHGHRTEAIRVYRQLAEAVERDLGIEPDAETQALYRQLHAGGLAAPGPMPAVADARAPVQPNLAILAVAGADLSGRRREMAALLDAFAQAQAGQGRLAILQGAAGTGKTRLLAECLRAIQGQGGMVLWGRTFQAEGQLPFGPIQDALGTFLSVQPLALLRQQAAYHGVLAGLIPDLAQKLPDLPPQAPLEPRAERHRLFAALAGLLRDLAARRPLALALDDLHWADRTTLEALHYLARSCADCPLLLICSYRAEDLQQESSQAELLAAMGRMATVVELEPLDGGDTAALIRTLLAPERVDERVRRLIAEQARGNPLYVQLLVAALRESGRIAVVDGAWRLRGTPGGEEAEAGQASAGSAALPVPAALRTLILERAGGLSQDAAKVLRLCAVLGQHLIYQVLVRAADLEEEDLLDALDDLLAAALLEETGQTAGPGTAAVPGYAFRHPLMQEAIYQQIPARRLPLLHRRAGEALEAHLGRRRDECAADLARHFHLAGIHHQAVAYAEIAGDRAAAAYAAPEAIAHYLLACDHRRVLLDDAQDEVGRAPHAEALAGLAEKLGDLRSLLGQYAAAEEDYRAARLGQKDPARRAELRGKEADTWQKRGDFPRALEALAAAEEEGVDLPARVRAGLVLKRGQILYHQGRFAEAVQAAAQALQLLGEGSDDPVAVRAHLLIGNVHIQQSDLPRAEDAYRQSLALAERRADDGDQESIATAWNGIASVAHYRGDLALAEECHRRSLAIRERIGHEWGIGASWNNLGNLEFDRGNYIEAGACYRRSLAIWERLGEPNGIGAAWNNLGDVALICGDLDEAARCQERGLAAWEPIGNRPGVSSCLKNLGSIALARGALAEARRHFEAAAPLLEESGVVEYLATLWIGLGQVAALQGDLAVALARFREARRVGTRISNPAIRAAAALQSGWAYLRTGRPRAAGAMQRCASALVEAHDLKLLEIDALLLRAELWLASGDGAAADAEAARALQLAVRRHARREEALALYVRGEARSMPSPSGAAREDFEAALAIQAAHGFGLDAARTRLALARCMVSADPAQTAAAWALVEEARAAFVEAGAAPDLAEAARLLALAGQASPHHQPA